MNNDHIKELGQSADKLLPCPFCEQPPTVHEYSNGWVVDCSNDDCWVRPTLADIYHHKRDAIAFWNNRVGVTAVLRSRTA